MCVHIYAFKIWGKGWVWCSSRQMNGHMGVWGMKERIVTDRYEYINVKLYTQYFHGTQTWDIENKNLMTYYVRYVCLLFACPFVWLSFQTVVYQ